MAQIKQELEHYSKGAAALGASVGAGSVSTASSQIEALARVALILASDDHEIVRRYGMLWAQWLADGAVEPLDTALGLRQRGGPSLRRSIAIADRDAILCRLMAAHPDWRGLEPTIVARRMRKEFERYETGRWLRERDAIAAPSAEPFASFWRLLRHDLGMPKFDRLREILANGIQSPV